MISEQFKDFGRGNGVGINPLLPPGAKDSNIMLWPRATRAKYNCEGKDPLAQFSDKDLRSGELVLG